MNTYNACAIFMLLGLWPHSYSAMESSNLPLLLDQGTSFLAMVKSNPSYLQFHRIKRLSQEYDASMHAIFADSMVKPHSVLPNSFYSSGDAHRIPPREKFPEFSLPQQDLAVSYWCGLCHTQLLNSQEYDAHQLHGW